ncbi:unnamed protein product [Ectocarpus sp. 6 AP-2014]
MVIEWCFRAITQKVPAMGRVGNSKGTWCCRFGRMTRLVGTSKAARTYDRATKDSFTHATAVELYATKSFFVTGFRLWGSTSCVLCDSVWYRDFWDSNVFYMYQRTHLPRPCLHFI